MGREDRLSLTGANSPSPVTFVAAVLLPFVAVVFASSSSARAGTAENRLRDGPSTQVRDDADLPDTLVALKKSDLYRRKPRARRTVDIG